jgi:branched-chain amino acid aminotransferase
MINFDGICYSRYKDVPEQLLFHLTNLPVHTHYLLSFKGQISLLEAHYFSIMAALRQSRVEIPMQYSLTFFQEQMEQLSDYLILNQDVQCFRLKFYRTHNLTTDKMVSPIYFVMQVHEISWGVTDLNLTLYKDHYLFANDYSNLFQTNASLHNLGQVFAYENDFGAALILNNHRRLAESTHGAVFLFHEGKIQTPALSEGTVDAVLRKALIDFLIRYSEWEVIETQIPIFSIQQAQEVFLISSDKGWAQINQFRKKKFEKVISELIYGKFSAHLKS